MPCASLATQLGRKVQYLNAIVMGLANAHHNEQPGTFDLLHATNEHRLPPAACAPLHSQTLAAIASPRSHRSLHLGLAVTVRQ